MKRPSIAWAIVLSLVATLATATSPTATAAPAVAPAAVATQIDLTNPTAGINDPLASMPVLDRNCKAGQTDVNTATAAQLMAAFHIDADTAGRVIAGREWLKATDAISVPGVPSSSYQYIRANGCATPITLPPVPVNQCKSGSTALDLQVATQSQLMKIAGLSKTTSLSLIAARPLPDNLHQVAAPVVSGLSDSKITELLTSGKYCITPPPFTYSGRTWRWATGTGGATVTAVGDERYALFVPPGAIQSDGAYATVQPFAPEFEVLPRADFHIWGTWSGEVATRLPVAFEGSAAADIVVWHDAADGPRVSASPDLSTDGKTVTNAVTSLSEEISALKPISAPCNNAKGTIWCGVESPMPWDNLTPTRDAPLADLFRRLAAYQEKYNPAPRGPCPDGSTPLIVTRGDSWLKCSLAEAGNNATATFTNDLGGADMFMFGNTWQVTTDRGQLTPTHPDPMDRGFVTTWLFNVAADLNPNYVFPMYGTEIKFAQGDPATSVTTRSADVGRAASTWGTYQVTSIGDAMVMAGFIGNPALYLTNCVPGSSSVDFRLMTDCAKKQLEVAGKAGLAKYGVSSKEYAKLASSIKALAKAAVVLDIIGSIGSWIAGAVEPKTATLEYKAPPPPVSTGGGAGSLSIMGDGKFIAMDGHRALLVSPPPIPEPLTAEWTAQEIATNDGFNCYAEGYLAIDQVETYTGTDGREYLRLAHNPVVLTTKAPDCTRGGPHWDYASPVTMGGNTPLGVVLKEPDWQGSRTWWVTATGEIQRIPDGGTYLCLVNRAPVLWNFGKRYAEAWVQPLTDPVTPPVTDSTGPTASCP